MKRWICIFCSVLVLSGCTAEFTENSLAGLYFTKANEMIGDKTEEERASSIKWFLRQVEGISGSAVVVEGHTAIIGLRLEDGEKENSQQIMRKAELLVKQADEYTTSTSITTNLNIVGMLEEMERKRAG